MFGVERGRKVEVLLGDGAEPRLGFISSVAKPMPGDLSLAHPPLLISAAVLPLAFEGVGMRQVDGLAHEGSVPAERDGGICWRWPSTKAVAA